MLKHDSSEETKTYSADSYEKKRSAERARTKLKKDIIDIQEKAIYESHENKLVYTYVKDIQKNIYKIGKTMTLMPGLRACVLRGKYSIALVNKTLKIFCTYADNRIVNETIN
jgi:hypothetical protein